ncbi:MAG TPA: hypothetical protein VNJ29_01815 [Candidatus Nitrosotenuis sp.]|jgi:hypothetical protein|nr:hypothetical protein [Candidatus Nitrosotenuis sp.]
MSYRIHRHINILLVSFWTLWLFIVFVSDCCDLLIYFNQLPTTWPFNSHNLNAVLTMIQIYNLSPSIGIFLFVLIILWCLGNLGIFLKALFHYPNRYLYLHWSSIGYLFLIGLHLCFDIADEIFIFYEFTDGLMARLSVILLSYGCLMTEQYFLLPREM